MKTFTSLLIGLSLAVAGIAFAQQTEETPGPGKTQGATEKPGKTHAEKTAKPEATTAKSMGGTTTEGATGAEQGTGRGHKGKAAESNVSGQTTGGVTTETGTGKGKGRMKAESSATGATTETGVNATTETGTGKGKGGRAKTEASVSASETGVNATTETGTGKGRGKARAKTETSTATGATGTSASAEASATMAPTGKAGRGEKATKTGVANTKATAAPSMTPVAAATAAPSIAASASTAPSVAAATGATGGTGQLNATTNANAPATTGAATAHVEKQKVEQVKQQSRTIKEQHVNFKAERRPDRVPAVTFNVNYRIQGSDRWQGPQYEAFRTYRSERHDRNWYHSRYHRVELIAGGYYYFNNGYWYPAWGYDPGNEYYAYDAPIYVGHRAEPPDRVIADVQAELQEMGYYRGEVDGLTGPLTREALANYQADQGLQVTAVMDEPTLDSLNLSS